MDDFRNSSAFTPEQKDLLRREPMVGIGLLGPCAQQDEKKLLARTPLFEGSKGCMSRNTDMLDVIHAGAAHALVTDLLSIAGITTVGGRSVGEIADRFLEQAALGAQTSLPRETRAYVARLTGRTAPAAAFARRQPDDMGKGAEAVPEGRI